MNQNVIKKSQLRQDASFSDAEELSVDYNIITSTDNRSLITYIAKKHPLNTDSKDKHQM